LLDGADSTQKIKNCIVDVNNVIKIKVDQQILFCTRARACGDTTRDYE